MKIYKVSLRTYGDEHLRYEYYSSKREAEKTVKEYTSDDDELSAEIEPIEIEANKKGIIAALNRHGGHANNG